jgi:hypothetical protein
VIRRWFSPLPVTITFGLASSVFVIRDVLWSMVSGPQQDSLAQTLLITEEELSTSRLSSLILIFAAGSILVFFSDPYRASGSGRRSSPHQGEMIKVR